MTNAFPNRSRCLAVERLDARCCPSVLFLEAGDSGWYNQESAHDPGNQNYLAGEAFSSEYRNFFVFGPLEVTETIRRAELRLSSPTNISNDPSETFTVFDVATSIEQLTAGGNDRETFNDLGSGVVYGQKEVSVGDDGTLITVPLNTSGVAFLNGHLKRGVAFGGAITTISGTETQCAFGFTGTGSRRLLVLELADSRQYRSFHGMREGLCDPFPARPSFAPTGNLLPTHESDLPKTFVPDCFNGSAHLPGKPSPLVLRAARATAEYVETLITHAELDAFDSAFCGANRN